MFWCVMLSGESFFFALAYFGVTSCCLRLTRSVGRESYGKAFTSPNKLCVPYEISTTLQ